MAMTISSREVRFIATCQLPETVSIRIVDVARHCDRTAQRPVAAGEVHDRAEHEKALGERDVHLRGVERRPRAGSQRDVFTVVTGAALLSAMPSRTYAWTRACTSGTS